MGLINLLTDPKNFKFYNGGQGYTGNGNQPGLTNIPYGKDRIDGGSSGQPYIQIPIPDDISNLGAVNKDFILRGGTLAVSNSATDALRLTKMFGDLKSPSGLLFASKQQILSRTAVRTQASGKGLNEGIYNPLTTIAQAGVVAFGIHLNKQSLIIPYSETVTNNQQPEDNRLYSLYDEKIINKRGSLPGIKGFATDPISLNPLLLSYSGGPGSTLGVGKTNIRFADQRTGVNNSLAKTNPIYFYKGSSRSIDTLNNNQISQGGILIDPSQSWTTTGKYKIYDVSKSKYINYTSSVLPLFDVNTPQEAGTILQNNTDIPQYTKGSDFIWGKKKKFSSNYLNYVTIQNSRNIENNKSLEIEREQSPYIKNNKLVDEIVPENQRIIGVGGSFIQKNIKTEPNTLNIDAIQESGLIFNVSQSWTYDSYQIKSGSFGKQDLPKFNVKVSQNQGTILQITGEKSWNPQYDIATKNTSSLTNRVSNTYQTLASGSKINNSGSYNNVYNSGSLKNNQLIRNNNTYTYSQTDLIDEKNNPGKLSFSPAIRDFRAVLRDKLEKVSAGSKQKAIDAGQLTEAPNYIDKSIEKRVKIGGLNGDGPGARAGKSYANYTNGVVYSGGRTGPLDDINALLSYKDTEADDTISDLCNFRIAIIDNNTPTLKTFLHFRAFLNSISDAYTAEWNPTKYLGRGESFYNYNGFTRQMSLSWTVAAQSKQELIPMYKRLNYLASSLTPEYSPNGYMRGNMVQFTIGGYIYEQPGIITSLTYDISEDTTWEIGIDVDGERDTKIKQLPHILKVTCNFTPIQKFRPEVQYFDNDYKHYISLEDPTGNEYGSTAPDVTPTDVTPEANETNTDEKRLINPKIENPKYIPPPPQTSVPPRYSIPDDKYSNPELFIPQKPRNGFGGGGFGGGGAGGSW
jgi:hypothetical protein